MKQVCVRVTDGIRSGTCNTSMMSLQGTCGSWKPVKSGNPKNSLETQGKLGDLVFATGEKCVDHLFCFILFFKGYISVLYHSARNIGVG